MKEFQPQSQPRIVTDGYSIEYYYYLTLMILRIMLCFTTLGLSTAADMNDLERKGELEEWCIHNSRLDA